MIEEFSKQKMAVWNTSFKLKGWSAWSPEMQNLEGWLSWSEAPREVVDSSAPAIKFLNANLRRRASQLSRMSLEVAYRLLPPAELASVRTVFGSRHGECRASQSLLEMLAVDELVSPMAFSLSVHNAGAGLFSIASGNKEETSAIAANKQTFCYSLLEALTSSPSEEPELVMLLLGEELVPDLLAEPVKEWRVPFCLGLLLEVGGAEGGSIGLSLKASSQPEDQYETLSQGLVFLRWLLGEDRDLLLSDARLDWSFSKESPFSSRELYRESYV